jgi:ATP-dependent exoDNAse (exonuclease V) beta subunit
MKSTLEHILSKINADPRDKNIKFFEKGHKYVISVDPNTTYTSVTTWNHTLFPQFDADEVITNMMKGKGWKEGHKYWGQTPEQIKQLWDSNKNTVANSGTDLHFEIECFMNNKKLKQVYYTNQDLYKIYQENPENIKTSIEWQYFINFIKDHPELKPYRTEWLIYDEDLKISGSIDMVYENPDGTLSIYDWKRAKNITRINNFNRFALHPFVCHLPDSNYWHYAMQLNTYKYILERKYNKKIRDLFLVRLHPEAEEKNYELITLPNLSTEIEDLFLERKKQIYGETA